MGMHFEISAAHPASRQAVQARKAAEAVLTDLATAPQPTLADLLANYQRVLDAFGIACNLTDDVWRRQKGLREEPTRADHRAWERLNEAHNRACRSLLDYQPQDMNELAFLANMFTDISVCDPEDGITALARMARHLAGSTRTHPALPATQ